MAPRRETVADRWWRRRAPAAGCGSGARASGATAQSARDGCGERGEIGEEEEGTVPIPYLWGAPERFPIFPPTISQIVGGIGLCRVQHVSARGAILIATPKATQTQRLGFGSSTDPCSRTRAASH